MWPQACNLPSRGGNFEGIRCCLELRMYSRTIEHKAFAGEGEGDAFIDRRSYGSDLLVEQIAKELFVAAADCGGKPKLRWRNPVSVASFTASCAT